MRGIFYLAAREAEKSQMRHRVGAVAFKKGKLVGNGFNFASSCSPTKRHTRHAEFHAFVKSKENPDSILVTRVSSTGLLSLSKPCFKCQTFLRKGGVTTVFYTDENGQIRKMKL